MNRRYQAPTEIFSGAFLARRSQWRRGTRLLPPNSCVLIFDHHNAKQTKLMKKVAQLFRNKGRKVYLWHPSTALARTSGNKAIDTPNGEVKLGLNCYP